MQRISEAMQRSLKTRETTLETIKEAKRVLECFSKAKECNRMALEEGERLLIRHSELMRRIRQNLTIRRS